MKLSELFAKKCPTMSFEVFPPKTSDLYASVEHAISEIALLRPDFMSVTYGAGGGTFILLSFALLNKLDLITASGNTKVCSSVASVSAAVTYACSGAVVWQVVLPAALLNLLGNYIGAGLALHKGAKVIRPMFLVVLLMLLVRLAVSLFF